MRALCVPRLLNRDIIYSKQSNFWGAEGTWLAVHSIYNKFFRTRVLKQWPASEDLFVTRVLLVLVKFVDFLYYQQQCWSMASKTGASTVGEIANMFL